MSRQVARRSIAILLLAAVGWQLVSIPLARWTLGTFFGATDAYTQWTAYDAGPAPDVVFIGDSRVRSHVDPVALGAVLGTRVAKIGVSGATPRYLDALAYRILDRDSRPRVLVVSLSEYQFNESLATDLTSDYWQISGPPDPRFVLRALGDANDPGRLAAGWLVPALANNRVIAYGLRCVYRTRGAPDACKDEEQFPERIMTAETRRAVDDLYMTLHLARYRYSEADDVAVRRIIAEARSRGVDVRLLVPPMLDFDTLAPDAYALFTERVQRIARDTGTPLFDLHTEMRDQLELWRDPSHLTTAGARTFAALLAAVAK